MRIKLLSAFSLMAAMASGCGAPAAPVPPEETVHVPAEGTVVVYVEAARKIAGPILKTFEEQTGIDVQPVYRESLGERFEAALKSEAAARRVDVVWAASPLLAIDLAEAGLAAPFRPAGARFVPAQYRDRSFRWIGFAAVPRIIVYNSGKVAREDTPSSIEDLARPPWAGKAALARIGRGTPAFHAAALFALWGEERATEFFDRVAGNGNRIVEDDAAVRALVAAGDAPWGLLDLDEAICAKREAEPLDIVFPDRLGFGAILAPQPAVLVEGAPHLAQAKGLYGYLFSKEAAWQLGQNDCAQIALVPDVPRPDWVPSLAVLNVAQVDNARVWAAWRKHRALLESWGGVADPGAVAALARAASER